jgi:hypothetical protein
MPNVFEVLKKITRRFEIIADYLFKENGVEDNFSINDILGSAL